MKNYTLNFETLKAALNVPDHRIRAVLRTLPSVEGYNINRRRAQRQYNPSEVRKAFAGQAWMSALMVEALNAIT